MFLKSIEVQGFKSFANKLKFEFKEGITCIVGPNGSGKSNVADAVRWVLGEQSAKQLRGNRMEDVIFSGTESRKAIGFAYVAITLDNSDHKLSIDYDTVTVSRRVYRSGESEYKINGHSCRLRDIQELFFDTGIGKEGYSIIGQGQIDKILSGKPEDRRELFDEAAGIVKFKRRKAVTEKNLETERMNLSRLSDILYELEKQLGPLKKQNEDARKYLEYKEKLKIVEANSYVKNFSKLREDIGSLDEKLSILKSQTEETNSKYDSIKETYHKIEELIEKYDQEIDSLTAVCNENSLQQQKLAGEEDLIRTRLESTEKDISEVKESLEVNKSQLKEKLGKIDELESARQAFIEEQELLKKDTDDAQRSHDDYSAAILKLRNSLDNNNSEIISLMNELSELKSLLERYDTLHEQGEDKNNEIKSRLEGIAERIHKEDELTKAFNQELDEITASIKELKNKSEKCRIETETLKSILESNRAEAERINKEYLRQSARYETLKNYAERYEGYGYSIRRIMDQKKKNSGIIGVVADIINVDRKYEIALTTALGGAISNIVVEDEKTAKEMIEYLKQGKYGRATFLPITSVKGRKNEDAKSVCGNKGVIGIASDLVKCKDRFNGIKEHLLGRIYVTDTIDNALALAKKYKYSLRIVTLQGEQLMPGGSLSGGSYKNSSNLLGRQRELDELKDKVKELSGELNDTSSEEKKLRKEIEEKSIEAEKYNEESAGLLLRENTVRLRLSQVTDGKAADKQLLDETGAELESLKEQKSDIFKKRDDVLEKIRINEERIREKKELAADLSGKLDEMTEKEKILVDETSDLRIKHTQIVQKAEFAGENLRRCKAEADVLREVIAEEESRYTNAGQSIRQLTDEREGIKNKKSALEKIIEGKQRELADVRNQKERYTSENKSFFEKREELAKTLSDLDREGLRLSAQKEKLEEKRINLSNYMWEEYALTVQGSREWIREDLISASLSQLAKAAAEIKEDIKALGNINVGAIEEYKSVSQRYEEMKKQYDDVADAEGKLLDIASSLEVSMKEQFEERFALIQKEFDRVFRLLFGGGKGTLSLSEPDDLLETGIIITAQPPGKKLQNMMQLSGGEKALTAIALLFAIQSLKPSPFCLLDEIEAALDDANVKRFAQYLHNLTDETQFIVITHRRGTMKAADILYGITMQEKGVSTLVSVSLIDKDLTA